MPSTQLSRLRGLYQDLYTEISKSTPPLLPTSHPILGVLSSPPSPTSAPLSSAIFHLGELASALRERCAPIRDASFDRVLARLSDAQRIATSPLLAQIVVDATRMLLDAIAQMQTDMKTFMLSAIPESELQITLRETAREGEREAVTEMYGGEEGVRSQWVAWAGDKVEKWSWIGRLVDALGSDVPVACPSPVSRFGDQEKKSMDPSDRSGEELIGVDKHILPSVFLFNVADLVRLQDRIQALVIAAALRTLIPDPQHSNSTDPTSQSQAAAPMPEKRMSFAGRILTLLQQEISESLDRDEGNQGDRTKLSHLVDEVIKERNSASLSGSSVPSPQNVTEERSRIQLAVSALLRVDSGVFRLLRTRLLSALSSMTASQFTSSNIRSRAPVILRTGTTADERPYKRPRLNMSSQYSKSHNAACFEETIISDIKVKGFDYDLVLQSVLKELLRDIVHEVQWIHYVWDDFLITGYQTQQL